MINKKILLSILLIVALVVVSGCTQEPPKPTGTSNDIKSEGEVQKTVQNITNDVKDLGNTLNDLDNVFN